MNTKLFHLVRITLKQAIDFFFEQRANLSIYAHETGFNIGVGNDFYLKVEVYQLYEGHLLLSPFVYRLDIHLNEKLFSKIVKDELIFYIRDALDCHCEAENIQLFYDEKSEYDYRNKLKQEIGDE